MSQLTVLIQQYGVLLVFGTVLLEQFGLPIPAFPVLVLAGAMAMEGGASWQLCLVAVLLACLICDLFWFRAGRYYGKRVLRLLCRISLSPDSCVNQTEDHFRRYGPKSLLVSKFIPGGRDAWHAHHAQGGRSRCRRSTPRRCQRSCTTLYPVTNVPFITDRCT